LTTKITKLTKAYRAVTLSNTGGAPGRFFVNP